MGVVTTLSAWKNQSVYYLSSSVPSPFLLLTNQKNIMKRVWGYTQVYLFIFPGTWKTPKVFSVLASLEAIHLPSIRGADFQTFRR